MAAAVGERERAPRRQRPDVGAAAGRHCVPDPDRERAAGLWFAGAVRALDGRLRIRHLRLCLDIRFTFWPSLAVTLLLLAFGRPLLSLFGPGFGDGHHLMFIMAVGLVARAAIGPMERFLNMLGQQRACALVYASAFGINVAL